MQEPFEELYKGYLLKCAPHPTPDGRFAARLVVSVATSDGHDEIMLTPDRPSFATAREAADCSLTVGQKWVERG